MDLLSFFKSYYGNGWVGGFNKMFDFIIDGILTQILESFKLLKPENKQPVRIEFIFLILDFQNVGDNLSEFLYIFKLALLTERVEIGLDI